MAERLTIPASLGYAAALGFAAALGLLAGRDPQFALALAFGLAFFLVCFQDLSLGLAVYTFVSFVQLPAFDAGDDLARLTLATAWFAAIATARRRELEFFSVHRVATALAALFLAWTLASIAWAENADEVLRVFQQYALDVLLLLVVFTAVAAERDLRRVIAALVFGAVAASVYGLVSPPAEGAEGRLGTELLDPNLLAASLVAATALAFGLLAMTRSAIARLAIIAAGTFCGAAVWFTASRGGLIALIVAAAAAIIFSGRWRPRVILVAVVAALASFIYFAGVAPDETRERITEPFEGQERIVEGRTTIWQVAWRAVEENPVDGVGAGNFRTASRHFLLEPGSIARSDQIIEDPKVAHNAFLEVLAELGLIGLLLFVGLISFCVACPIRAASRFGASGDHRMQIVAISVAVALIGTLAANFFISDHYSKQLWILLGLSTALLSLAPSRGTDHLGRGAPPGARPASPS